MSQQQFFGDSGSPSFSGIETVTGNTGGAVPGQGVPVNLNLVGDTAQGVSVNGDAGTSTETITVQNSTAAATSGAALKGVASFNSADFTDVSGFVSAANSMTGTATTVGAVVATTITLPLGATPACYQIHSDTVGFAPAGPYGESVSEILTVRTDGATATIIDAPDFFSNIESPLVPALFFTTVSGNNVIVQVLGSPGNTVNWFSKLTYIKVE